MLVILKPQSIIIMFKSINNNTRYTIYLMRKAILQYHHLKEIYLSTRVLIQENKRFFFFKYKYNRVKNTEKCIILSRV